MPLSLSFDWYHIDTGDSTFDMSGWNAFEFADFALIAAAAVALLGVARSSRAPTTAAGAFLGAGAATVVIVVIQMIDKPPLLGFGLHSSLRVGAFLGLAGAVLVLIAGVLQLVPRSERSQSRASSASPGL
jgi:hypothetical protein